MLPVVATEAHGAHLPLGTDSLEARENCRRAALRLEALGCPVVLGPVIPFWRLQLSSWFRRHNQSQLQYDDQSADGSVPELV